jgi:DNA-binding transcriptional ArsR family regulator
MTALAKANRVRLVRAQVKRDLRARRLTLADALEHPAVQSMTLAALLDAQERWGDARVMAFLARLSNRGCPISPSRRIGDLTPRQREIVLAPKPAPPLDEGVHAILRHLARCSGHVSAAEIADATFIKRLGIGGKLTALRGHGLVESVIREAHRRDQHFYRLTALGSSRLEADRDLAA